MEDIKNPGKQDTRHMGKVRDAANRDISSPADPSARRSGGGNKATITTPGRFAGRTASPRSGRR